MTDIYTAVPYFDYRYSNGAPMQTCARDLQALELLRADLHAEFPNDYANPLFIFQGCYHDGAQSAQTHMGSSVYDLHPSDFEAKARLGAKHGIVVFHRLALPGVWGEHCHIVITGGGHTNAQATAQIGDWHNHLNGLSDHSKYDTGADFPWFPIDNVFRYRAPKPPPNKPEFPDISEVRGDAGAEHVRLWNAYLNADAKAKAHPHVPELTDTAARFLAAADEIHPGHVELTKWLENNGAA